MVLEVFGLPQVPNCKEYFAVGFKVVFNLLKYKEVLAISGKVVENSDTKNIVILR